MGQPDLIAIINNSIALRIDGNSYNTRDEAIICAMQLFGRMIQNQKEVADYPENINDEINSIVFYVLQD